MLSFILTFARTSFKNSLNVFVSIFTSLDMNIVKAQSLITEIKF